MPSIDDVDIIIVTMAVENNRGSQKSHKAKSSNSTSIKIKVDKAAK